MAFEKTALCEPLELWQGAVIQVGLCGSKWQLLHFDSLKASALISCPPQKFLITGSHSILQALVN